MRHAIVGEPFIDHVPVFEDNGYTKRSGLTAADFTITVWAEGVEVPIPVDIDEIVSTPGEYLIGMVPAAEGYWRIEILVNHNKEILVSEFETHEYDATSIGDLLVQIMDGGTGLFVPADSLHSRGEDFGRILGLLHHNGIVDNHQYDGNGQLIAFRLRCFDSPGNVPDIPGGTETTGLLYEYEGTAEFDGVGSVKLYKMEKVL